MLFLLLACSDGSSSSSRCADLWNTTWASTEEHECGLGADGEESLCTWMLTFGDGTFDWQHSDYGESGTVTCTEGALEAESSSATYEGTYDGETLTWDGFTYTLD